jgi:RimJ/RimL family protein N-acetyltransferase
MNVTETARLILCRLSTDDAPFILKLLNDPDWLKFIGDKGVRNLDDARNYILNGPIKSYNQFGFGLFLTKLKEDDVPIGICGLLKREYLEEIDIGFAFLPQFRGKGYAVESAIAVLEYGKTTFGLKKIVAITQPDNIRSIQVLEKIGLEFQKITQLPDDDQELELYGRDL